MLAARRARTTIANFPKIVSSLQAPIWKRIRLWYVFFDACQRGRKIKEHPVHPRLSWRVRVVHNQSEARRIGWSRIPFKRRRNIRAIAGILRGNGFPATEGGAYWFKSCLLSRLLLSHNKTSLKKTESREKKEKISQKVPFSAALYAGGVIFIAVTGQTLSQA